MDQVEAANHFGDREEQIGPSVLPIKSRKYGSNTESNPILSGFGEDLLDRTPRAASAVLPMELSQLFRPLAAGARWRFDTGKACPYFAADAD